ncbi:MAG: ATP-binding protein [Ruminococcus flavefaciens]|nr:ATP-binding protein [Ruminococcus flavefaciens]
MGIYLNPKNILFQEALNSKIYVDKSMIIKHTNDILRTTQKYICISRPRRFGKSITADMLTAYYSRGCDSREMFSGLKIAKADSFEKHLNKYNVIHINMVEFLTDSKNMDEMIKFIQDDLIYELKKDFPDVNYPRRETLTKVISAIFEQTGISFVFIIDEWDCIFRIHKNDIASQTKYLDFLRNLLKDQSFASLVYMTGILPIKKYGEHSALNMFTEISMTNAREYGEFTGFTEDEVKELCEKYDMSFDETKRWYDGYNLKGLSIYNPRSVVMSMTGHDYDSYWTSTETYEALKVYIKKDFDGLKDKVTRMIAGEKIKVNFSKFQNDMTTFNSADDVLTLLVHLGYLTYDFYNKEVWIPNSEIQQEFINSIEDGGWETVMTLIRQSDELLRATLAFDEEKVAEMMEQAHQDNVSVLQYNNEHSLSCTVSFAYYSARDYYSIYREMPAGKGFADLVFIPRKNCSYPAIIAELKYNKTVDSAINQIKQKNYCDCLQDYSGEVLLVGISYSEKTKKHRCKIEKMCK